MFPFKGRRAQMIAEEAARPPLELVFADKSDERTPKMDRWFSSDSWTTTVAYSIRNRGSALVRMKYFGAEVTSSLAPVAYKPEIRKLVSGHTWTDLEIMAESTLRMPKCYPAFALPPSDSDAYLHIWYAAAGTNQLLRYYYECVYVAYPDTAGGRFYFLWRQTPYLGIVTGDSVVLRGDAAASPGLWDHARGIPKRGMADRALQATQQKILDASKDPGTRRPDSEARRP